MDKVVVTQKTSLYGQYERLLRELTAEDIAGYKNFLRMNPEMVISVVMSCSRRLHGGCTEATEHIRTRRSLCGGDGSYTERLLREVIPLSHLCGLSTVARGSRVCGFPQVFRGPGTSFLR